MSVWWLALYAFLAGIEADALVTQAMAGSVRPFTAITLALLLFAVGVEYGRVRARLG